jgi:hypothetical protein
MGRERPMRRTPAAGMLLAALLTLVLVSPAAAAPSASMTARFAQGTRLGEGTLVDSSAEFTGTEYHGQPLPLSELTIFMPKGTSLSGAGLPACPGSVLEPSGEGPQDCPFGSRVWENGSALVHLEFGHEYIPEAVRAEVFFDPEGGVWLYLFGHEPVLVEVLAHGVYVPEAGGKGPGVKFELPIVETVPGGPLMDINRIAVPLGGFHGHEGTMFAGVTAPSECTTGLGWSASAKFFDLEGHEGSAEAETTSACPGTGKREATSTHISVSAPSLEEQVAEVVTAQVTPAASGEFTPGGDVLVDADSFRGCTGVLIEITGPGSEGSCHGESFELGPHPVNAIYFGDAHFAPSEATPLSVSVLAMPTEAELAEKHRAEAAAKRKHEEEAAAARKSEEEAARRAREAAAAQEVARRAHEAFVAAVGRLGSLLAPHGRSANIRVLLARGGYRTPASLPAGVTVTISWLQPGGGGHPKLLAKGSTTGPGTVFVRLTAAGRRWLRGHRLARVSARAMLAASGEATATRSASFSLRR